MIKKIFNKLNRLSTIIKLKIVERSLLRSDYHIVDSDFESKTFLIELGVGLSILMSFNGNVMRLETAITFDGDSLNLKTFSDLANIFYTADMPITGIYPQSAGKVKFYVNRSLPFRSVMSLKDILKDFHDGILLCYKYLSLREGHIKEPMLDLSMFIGIEMSGFNPKDIGEKKEFVFGTWSNFINAVVKSHEEGELNSEDAGAMLSELKACEMFESKNRLPLSEMGDVVWQEIIWNRNLEEQYSDDKTYIN